MKKSRFQIAQEAVSLGRSCLLSYFGKINQIENKEKQGLVSEADRACEEIMKNFLAQNAPEVDFLGEETSFLENTKIQHFTTGARWILDPLDGTTNYVHRFPIFCISLALEVDGEIQLGIIDMPMLNQTFTAQKNKGAFCNQEQIYVSKTCQFSEALLSTGFFAEDPSHLDEQLGIFSKLNPDYTLVLGSSSVTLYEMTKVFSQFVRVARGIRRPGAAAYDMALVGAGVFDLFWEKNLKPWDTAAGKIIIEEAGGVVKTYEGLNYTPYEKSLVAGNAQLVDLFLKEIQLLKK